MAAIEQQWKGIKKAFETAAKKKRPSEKTLLVFNKPSGLTPATAALDKAIAAQSTADIAKALAKLRTTATAYLATIAKSLASEKDVAGQALLKTMSDDVGTMIDDAKTAAKKAVQVERCAAASDLLDLMKNKAKGAQLLAYAKKSQADAEVEFILNMAAKKHTQATYDTFLAPRAPKSVDIQADVREEFETAMEAGDISRAPWGAATSWILTSVNDDVIAKYNSDVGKALA